MQSTIAGAVRAKNLDFPVFRPRRGLGGPHAQTIAGVYLPGKMTPYRARQHRIVLTDGDQIVLHDDCPAAWQPGQRAALMIHGLSGCHHSPYMRRIAHKLNARGVRSFRMDLRGCGAGFGLAQMPYHSGCSDDAAAALRWLAEHCPGSPVSLLGFSLGANVTLKLLGEIGGWQLGGLDSAVAVSPPVDLEACSAAIMRRENRIYDWNFVRKLWRTVKRHAQHLPQSPAAGLTTRPRTLREFDNAFTAPVCGFGTVENYYRECSSAKFIPAIELPTLVLSSRDDPFVPSEPLEQIALPANVQLYLTDHGGHLGFIGRGGVDPDRRWLDWRVVDWVTSLQQHAD